MNEGAEGLTQEQLERILANPIYTGVGHYPPLVDEETWIASGIQLISEIGADKYLRTLLAVLRESWAFAYLPTDEDE